MGRVVMNPSFSREMSHPANCARWQEVTAQAGTSALELYAPHDTGRLDASIKAERSMHTSLVRFTSNLREAEAPYDYFQEVGTGLYGPLHHWITPKRARFLSWVDKNGDRIFAKRVRGVKPQRFHYGAMVLLFGSRNMRYYGADGPKFPSPI